MTSQLKVPDIQLWKDTSAPLVEIKSLTKEAGGELLRENGVWGTDVELEDAANDYGGHPLAVAARELADRNPEWRRSTARPFPRSPRQWR